MTKEHWNLELDPAPQELLFDPVRTTKLNSLIITDQYVAAQQSEKTPSFLFNASSAPSRFSLKTDS